MNLLAQIKINPSEINLPVIAADTPLFNRIVALVYMIIAAVSLFFIVRGALLFVTSGSEPGEVKKARETILYSVVAMVGSTAVFALIWFVLNSIGGKPR